MKQLKETVGACSVLALGRPSPIPQSSYSPEEFPRKFMTCYNPDNININYPENQFIESLSMTNGYFYYPQLFAFDTPATTPITTSTAAAAAATTTTTTTTNNNTNNNNLSPISPPESCSNLNDLTETFTSTSHPSDFTNTSNNDHHHHHHHHQHPSSLPIKLESSRCPLDHDYNIALSLTKDLSINSLSSYSPTGTPMLSPLTDCFSLHNVAEPSYVNILSPTPDSIISEEKFTSNQSQNEDHHQLFDLDTFTFDPRDYFNFESFVSDAVRRKSLDDAIFLRRISSATPIKSEISFQQQLNRRRSLPSEFSQQRIQIEDDFSQLTAMSTSSLSSLSPLLPSSSSSSTIPTPASTSTPQKTTKTKQPRKSSKSLAPFACPHEHCSKTFTRQYNLKSHLRTHTDERPFVCNYPGCPRAFARQHDLKRHQKLHLGLKPHVCGNCGRAFARLDALNRHLRSDNAAQCAQVTMANNNNSSIGKLFKSSNI